MIKEALEWLRDMNFRSEAPQAFDKDGRTYTGKSFEPLKAPQRPTEIFPNLQGFSNFINAFRESQNQEKNMYLTIHVTSPDLVELLMYYPDVWNRRYVIAKAIQLQEQFPQGSWLDREEFLINLYQHFIHSDDREAIVKAVSQISSTKAVLKSDDGISQRIQINTGVDMIEKKDIKPIIQLTSSSIFPELIRDPSQFMLRARNDDADSEVKFALFRLEANVDISNTMRAIRDYLGDTIKDESIEII